MRAFGCSVISNMSRLPAVSSLVCRNLSRSEPRSMISGMAIFISGSTPITIARGPRIGQQGRAKCASLMKRRGWDGSGRPTHDVGLEQRIHRAVRRRRNTKPAAELCDLAAEPGQLEPVAALEVERHRRL